ncbi:lactate racemase domain-containing protein [bacterium]|nr:lactate racemase domain-containing protein [bacterium]
MAKRGQTVRLRVGSATHDSECDFALPANWTVTVCPMRDRPAMAEADVQRALAHPVGAEPISVAARGARTATLLVDDFRRPTPAEWLCRRVLDELQEAGIPPRQVSIVLGNGAHRTMNRREVRRRLGTLCDTVGQVVSHDAYSPRVTYMGLTSAGTPVLVNEVAAAADFSVTISCVYPHRLVAWAGGAKMVLPGICHVSTTHFHHGRLTGGPWGGPPRENASRRDIEEAAALFGLNVSLCAVINSRKEMCGLYAGDPTKAHRAAIALARKVGDTPMAEAHPDLIICNGYPLDADATQYSKVQAPALQFGCPMLLLSDFADPSIFHGLYHGPLKEFKKRPPLQPAPRTDELLMKAPVFFYSPQYGRGFVPPNRDWYCDNDWDRLMAAMARRFRRAKVAVFPVAPLQIPRIV